MDQLEHTRAMLTTIVGVEPRISTDWNEVLTGLDNEEGSVIIAFTAPGGGLDELLQWTLRGFDGPLIRYFDPNSDEPPGTVAGDILPAAGLPERRAVGDGHLVMAQADMASLFQQGGGRALIADVTDSFEPSPDFH
ncbi:MAG: hypothetical protein VKP62_14690 [Candidatus Sericytochromatia bacterium]|nr:hypothetical protein [Candidatus Sericytochromatia bacterium]